MRFLQLVGVFASALAFAAVPRQSQNPPADPAEISRDLLFLAPDRVEIGPSKDKPETLLFAQSFTYQYIEREGWHILPAKNAPRQKGPAHKAKLTVESFGTLVPDSDDDRATLALAPAGASEPLVTAVVWTRGELADAWLPFLQRQRKGLTRAALDKDLEVADPIITAATPGGTTVPAQALWVALAHSSGEDELGLGTVVRFAPAAKQAQVFHPPLLANCDITHLLSFDNDTFLLGTRLAYNRAVYPCVGLASLQARTGQTESISLPGPWPSPPMVTALGSSDRVWVATDSAICGGAPGGWLCWRIVPAVTLTSAMTVYNKPGEKAGAELKPGEYEVLWANQGFLEIATKDSYDAWLAADDYAEAAARNFDVEPWKLLNTATGISPIRPLTKPGGDALEGTLAFRARLEKLETPPGTPPGWVKVRIHAGWIERGALQVTPGMVPLPNK